MVKNPPANAGDTGDVDSIPEWGRSPGERNGNPLQCSWLGNPMYRGSLMGYSPWGGKSVGHDLATKQQQHEGIYPVLWGRVPSWELLKVLIIFSKPIL